VAALVELKLPDPDPDPEREFVVVEDGADVAKWPR
jgi:hypothetical protein